MKKEIFPIIGMHCASCKILIEKMVSEVEGVVNVNVNFATEKMSIEFDESKVAIYDLKSAVAKAGSYKLIDNAKGEIVLASPKQANKINALDHHHDHSSMLKKEEYQKLKKTVLYVGTASIPFLILMILMVLSSLNIIEMNTMFLGEIMIEKFDYKINLLFLVQFLIATPIIFLGGSQIFESAISALKAKAANMDSLIALGTFTAWAFSTIITFIPRLFDSLGDHEVDTFFEAGVFIIFFILLGRLLEARAKGQANDAIKKLLELQAKEATVLRDGKEVRVSLSEVVTGDLIVVKPGEKVPVDGKIIDGASTIDESMVTGESLPAEKTVGSNVIGSTINKSSTFTFKALKVGSETMLSQIIKLVEEAQSTSAPIQKIADKISGVFVPTVIMFALVILIFWTLFAPILGIVGENMNIIQLGVYIATTVLIIACPCALGLATPTAVMVGTGKAASLGILIKDAKALELAHKINVIVLDKTGTITQGEPKVTNYYFEGKDENHFLKLAKEVESKSEHPLSKAIEVFALEKISEESLQIKNFKNLEGMGVFANTKDGKKILIGNKKLMNEFNIKISKGISVKAEDFKNSGNTIVYFSLEDSAIGIFAIADTIKDSSIDAIKSLHNLGITIIMLTGDNPKTAQNIAQEVGIDHFIAEVLPAEKADIIKKIQQDKDLWLGIMDLPSQRVVGMVGDGINDAPALAQADVGIAMGTGTDIAIEAGDIVLVNGSLNKVLDTVILSKATLRIIKQNLTWAFGYNILAIPLAAGILYPSFGILLSPVVASAAMAFSSVSVVLNSLRLKRFKR